jgi:hypothetical protein
VLAEGPALDRADDSESLGQTGLLLTSVNLPSEPLREAGTYKVLDTSNPSHPGLLASIPAVKQRLTKADTGTLFLLNSDGVTVIRRLRVEEEHQVELDQQRGN